MSYTDGRIFINRVTDVRKKVKKNFFTLCYVSGLYF